MTGEPGNAEPGAAWRELLAEVRACRVCTLPLGPRPMLRIDPAARLLIIGQAPARRVHLGGAAWADAAGDRLRAWLGLDRASFEGPAVALMPIGLCYPGRGASGDRPPRKECAPLWHARLRAVMPDIRLTVLIGRHAQARYLPAPQPATLTAALGAVASYLPELLPLPHPSPRNAPWLARHPWFAEAVIPAAQRAVRRALGA